MTAVPKHAATALLDALTLEQKRRQRENRLSYYKPYDKQKLFHARGLTDRERLLMAGNQTGKTFCGGMEVAMHLTGLYPDWWEGRRWDRPVRVWAGSETGEVTRDGVQKTLVGEPKDRTAWGTGAVPKDKLKGFSLRHGVADSLDSLLVEHASGQGLSTLGFKSYDQGREKWQGETLDLVWFDEEPPMDVYMEGLTRTNATDGIVFLTFTPLKGMSAVVNMFITECGGLG